MPIKPMKPTPRKPLKGAAAAKKVKQEISPAGVAAAKKKQSAAIDKKYPGLYKKTK